MNSSKSMHRRTDGTEALGVGGMPRERIREKGRGVKMGLGEPSRGGT